MMMMMMMTRVVGTADHNPKSYCPYFLLQIPAAAKKQPAQKEAKERQTPCFQTCHTCSRMGGCQSCGHACRRGSTASGDCPSGHAPHTGRLPGGCQKASRSRSNSICFGSPCLQRMHGHMAVRHAPSSHCPRHHLQQPASVHRGVPCQQQGPHWAAAAAAASAASHCMQNGNSAHLLAADVYNTIGMGREAPTLVLYHLCIHAVCSTVQDL